MWVSLPTNNQQPCTVSICQYVGMGMHRTYHTHCIARIPIELRFRLPFVACHVPQLCHARQYTRFQCTGCVWLVLRQPCVNRSALCAVPCQPASIGIPRASTCAHIVLLSAISWHYRATCTPFVGAAVHDRYRFCALDGLMACDYRATRPSYGHIEHCTARFVHALCRACAHCIRVLAIQWAFRAVIAGIVCRRTGQHPRAGGVGDGGCISHIFVAPNPIIVDG